VRCWAVWYDRCAMAVVLMVKAAIASKTLSIFIPPLGL
jgi:hypothetical protein